MNCKERRKKRREDGRRDRCICLLPMVLRVRDLPVLGVPFGTGGTTVQYPNAVEEACITCPSPCIHPDFQPIRGAGTLGAAAEAFFSWEGRDYYVPICQLYALRLTVCVGDDGAWSTVLGNCRYLSVPP